MSANVTPTRNTQGDFAKFFAEAARPAAVEDDAKRLGEAKKLYARVHHVTSSGFAQLGLPLKLRALLCAIIAAYNGETQFKASYGTLVYILFRRGDGRTFEAKRSEVRRLLKKLIEWQREHVTLCTVLPGGRVKGAEGYEYEDTKFDLVFLDALARAHEQTKEHPNAERVPGAVQAALCDLMKLPAFDNRFDVKEPSLNELQKRDMRTAITKALKAAEKEETMHRDPVAYVERLAAEMIEKARQRFNAPKPPAPDADGRISPAEARRLGCVVFDTPPPDACSVVVTINEGGATSRYDVGAETEGDEKSKIASKAKELEMLKPEATQRGGVPAPPVSNSLDVSEPESLQSITLFESVGAISFEVTMRDERTERAAVHKIHSGADLRASLSSYLARNANRAESFIVRPRGARLIQVDDLDASKCAKLNPFAFVSLRTSAGSSQSWLALSDDLSPAAFDEVRSRLLHGVGADLGANGATRWPDSINRKPKHEAAPPRVHLSYRKPGRMVTVAELESAGLLAPLPTLKGCDAPRRVSHPLRAWPDYEECLRVQNNPSKADGRFACKALRAGFTQEEVVAKLMELRPKAKRRPKYARDTVSEAARFISTNQQVKEKDTDGIP
jgi:hypothetical protein